jgi:hypothetical protein
LALLHRPVPARPLVLECARAVCVDGELRCGAEVEAVLLHRCGHLVDGVRSGDRLQTPGVCHGAGPSSAWGRMPPRDLAAHHVALDVNRDSLQDLTSLPGVGPVIAGRIVQDRPYRSVTDLLDVRGIGPIRLERMGDRVFVSN